MSGPFRPGPPPGPRPGPSGSGPGGFRPGPPPSARPAPPPGSGPVEDLGEDDRHPAVEVAVRAMANAATLAPADQIAQYEAAYETLRETLATIDQA
ncbi:hypothetical protein ACGFIR_30960 [Micromonospora sp. NPDC049051]|uniref:hypothetical protein n=1 Tax=Micromonospora sp. NPDC049051 TaxID=3364264 RepID=UPI003718EE90